MSDNELNSSYDADAGKSETYEVGYGKPPLRTRFAKGQSGNPNGRQPQSKNLATLLTDELNAKVAVTEKNKRKLKTKREVLITQVVNKAVGGDLSAFVRIAAMLEKQEAKLQIAQREDAARETITDADAQVLADFLRRLGSNAPAHE